MPDTSGTILPEDIKPGWYPIEADGTIVNNSSIDLIPKDLKPELLELAGEIVKSAGADVSVYLRGSAARGTFIQGFSDIDLIVIYQKENLGGSEKNLVNRIKEVTQTFSIGGKLDLKTVSESRLREDEQLDELRFLLQIQGLYLAGVEMPEFYSNPNLATCHYEIRILKNSFFRFERLMATRDKKTTIKLCSQIMKIFLRAGFELVMAKEHKYTRELPDCLEGFAVHYPKRAADMEEALKLVIKPVLYSHNLQFLTRSLNTFILAESIKLKK